jgi:Ca-activated chloride channel family protein
MLDQLHFLQPLWLIALLPLAILWWIVVRSKMSSSKAWEKVIDAKLLPLLLSGSDGEHSKSEWLAKSLLALAWFITIIALADPVWEKIPRPIFQTNTARVIVLDLSNSMVIDDLKPSRLARARFKIEDILSSNIAGKEEGQIGLVLFAGDAFTASPLTRDSETIRALLQVLTPHIMPSQGSRVDLGLQKAYELLTQAGVERGQVLLIADGVSDQGAALKAARKLKQSGHKLSVLAVGTEIGGKLPQVKYKSGESIVVALDSELLQDLAKNGGGNYHLISTNNTDLKSVLSSVTISANSLLEKNNELKTEDWKSSGPLIVLLLLPLVALAFRRGWLFNILLVAGLVGITQPQPVYASPFTETLGNTWNNLWINKEQQAEKALQKKQFDKVTELSKSPLMQGAANYKKKDYKKSLEDFKQANGADARYNEGNAFAKLEKYEEAISAYDRALKLQPEMQDAQINKAAIEALLKNKKEKKSDSDKKQDSKNKDNKQGEEGQKGNTDNKKKEGKDSKKGEEKQDKEGKEKNNEDSKDNGEKSDDKNGENGDKKNNDQSKNQFSDANKNLEEKDKKKETSKKGDDDNPDDENKEKQSQQIKEDENKKTSEAGKENSEEKGTKTDAEELSKEEKMAAEQWLRRIPDDPGGLLRRKFQLQYQQRKPSKNEIKQPW